MNNCFSCAHLGRDMFSGEFFRLKAVDCIGIAWWALGRASEANLTVSFIAFTPIYNNQKNANKPILRGRKANHECPYELPRQLE
jgi:hypothetical protein